MNRFIFLLFLFAHVGNTLDNLTERMNAPNLVNTSETTAIMIFWLYTVAVLLTATGIALQTFAPASLTYTVWSPTRLSSARNKSLMGNLRRAMSSMDLNAYFPNFIVLTGGVTDQPLLAYFVQSMAKGYYFVTCATIMV